MGYTVGIIIYTFLHIFFAALDLVLGYKAYGYRKQTRGSVRFAIVCVSAAVVTLSYLGSVLLVSQTAVMISSSVYFASIDVVVYSLLYFSGQLCEKKLTKAERLFVKALSFYGIADIAVLLTNPLTKLAMTYTAAENVRIAHIVYDFKPFYYGHLVYNYLMIIVIVGVLIYKIAHTPGQYRDQYLYFMAAFALIVGMNAVYLFIPEGGVLRRLDFSILGYSLGLCIMYWSLYRYTHSAMLEKLSMNVFARIDLAMVLFDNNGYLVMENAKAIGIFGDLESAKRLDMAHFISLCGMPVNDRSGADQYALQCNIRGDRESGIGAYCQYYKLKDDRGKTLGHVFLFDDREEDTDPLTGYLSWTGYERYVSSQADGIVIDSDLAIAVFDINGLEEINEREGQEAGDARLVELAKIMRDNMPASSFYVRGRNAYLIALSYGIDERSMIACAELVREAFSGKLQFGVSSLSRDNTGNDIMAAIAEAEKSMRNKKLVDQGAVRSQMLTSLVRALQESDSDTEAHVKRTQRMGYELGLRMGLKDIDLSRLTLLCLLHDIGKIGVPLDILNKPGKLTDDEWQVIRSHAVKGYEIAMSSRETEDIADMIKHHHERWDGGGYPDGLKGSDIPVLSRIIAVVDSYDAMVNDRSYRKAMPKEDAIAELDRCSGSQFDPIIVAEFKNVIEEHPEFADMMVKGATIESGHEGVMISFDFGSDAESSRTDMSRVLKCCTYTLDNRDYVIGADADFEQITGYRADELRERKMMQIDFIPREDRTEYARITCEQLKKSERANIRHRFIKADGSVIEVLCYGRRYYDSSVKEMRTEVLLTVHYDD